MTRIVVCSSVGSTNDELRRLAGEAAEEGTVVVAERQTAGRGRRGRAWHSAAGLGLYISALFRGAGSAKMLTRWTIMASLAAAEACRQVSGADIHIEWPNDLFWKKRKVAGVLAEAKTTGETVDELVLGTGINVAQDARDFPSALAREATSLKLASGREVEREGLAAAYLAELSGLASRLRSGDWGPIAERWGRLAPGSRDRAVRVLPASPGGAAVLGRTAGLDISGALRVRNAEGELQVVRGADSIVFLEGGLP